MAATGKNKAIVGRPPGGKPSISPNRALRESVSVLESHAMAAASGASGDPGGSKTTEGHLPGRNHSVTPNPRGMSADLEARPDLGKVLPPSGVAAEKCGENLKTPGELPRTTGKGAAGPGVSVAAKVAAPAVNLNPLKAVSDPGASSSKAGEVEKGPQPATGAAPAANIQARNVRFWEENAARTRNRERGVELKHHPTLLGAREVSISMDLWYKAVDKMSNALVGMVFGEKPSIGKMKGFVRRRWQDPDEAKVKVALLNDGIFLFMFANEELRNEALYGGHLTFDRKPLVFKEWSPDESYECCSVKSIPTWIRLPGMRAHIQGEEEILSMIVSVIGKPLKTDGYTADKSKMTFARVCVEVFADQEFPNEVIIKTPFGESFVQKIFYEWLPNRCVNCCCFGHVKDHCDKPILELNLSSDESESEGTSEEDDSEEEDHCDLEGEAPDPGGSSGKEAIPNNEEPSSEEREGDSGLDGEVVPETQDSEAVSPTTTSILNQAMDDFEREEGFKKVVSKKKNRKGKNESEKEIMDKMLAFAKEGWNDSSGTRESRSNRGGRGGPVRGGNPRGGLRGGMRGSIGNKRPNIQ